MQLLIHDIIQCMGYNTWESATNIVVAWSQLKNTVKRQYMSKHIYHQHRRVPQIYHLWCACKIGDINLVKYLASQKIDFTCNDWLSLKYACLYDKLLVVKYLFKCGADIETLYYTRDKCIYDFSKRVNRYIQHVREHGIRKYPDISFPYPWEIDIPNIDPIYSANFMSIEDNVSEIFDRVNPISLLKKAMPNKITDVYLTIDINHPQTNPLQTSW